MIRKPFRDLFLPLEIRREMKRQVCLYCSSHCIDARSSDDEALLVVLGPRCTLWCVVSPTVRVQLPLQFQTRSSR